MQVQNIYAIFFQKIIFRALGKNQNWISENFKLLNIDHYINS